MIFAVRPAPSSATAELRQVRRSLNTPVVSIAQLPVGPASAAIAVHEPLGDGGPHFTVAVRCERTRSVVFFARDGDGDNDPAGRSLAGDAALSLAESMGFLFDDWVATGHPATRDVANRIWGEFVESVESGAAGHSPSKSPGRAPAIPLTKFRRDLPWSEPESASSDSDRQLARQRGG